MAQPGEVRRRIVAAGIEMVGAGANASLAEIVHRANAPRGSIYHHLPRDKRELIGESAGTWAAELAENVLSTSAQSADAFELLQRLVEFHRLRLVNSDYRQGCPLMNLVTHEPMTDDVVRAVLADGFECWTDSLAQALTEHGLHPTCAEALALNFVAAVEGCTVLAGAYRSDEGFRELSRRSTLQDAECRAGTCAPDRSRTPDHDRHGFQQVGRFGAGQGPQACIGGPPNLS
jgi:AcrR family transcriptional regulator